MTFHNKFNIAYGLFSQARKAKKKSEKENGEERARREYLSTKKISKMKCVSVYIFRAKKRRKKIKLKNGILMEYKLLVKSFFFNIARCFSIPFFLWHKIRKWFIGCLKFLSYKAQNAKSQHESIEYFFMVIENTLHFTRKWQTLEFHLCAVDVLYLCIHVVFHITS